MTVIRLLLAALLVAFAAGASFAQEKAKPKPKKKPAKTYDYERSKYKSRELAEGEIKTYRFDAQGEPVRPGAKKKPAPGKKKRPEPPEEKPVERGCTEEKPCAAPDEAEAL